MEVTKETVLKGIECCSEFLCAECPYKKYEHHEYTIRCMHKLMLDINELVKLVL